MLIDQFYFCETHKCQTQSSAVQVEDVLYQNITGTSASPVAVNFDCSDALKCRRIVLQDVNLRYHHTHTHSHKDDNDNVRASCRNIQLTEIGPVTPLCPNNPDVTRSTTTTTNYTNSTPPTPSPAASHRTPSPANPRPAAPEPPRRNVIYVDDFGAKGNGNNDDTDVRTRKP